MKVELDTDKVIYDGNSFVVVYTQEQLQDRFEQLIKSIREDREDR